MFRSSGASKDGFCNASACSRQAATYRRMTASGCVSRECDLPQDLLCPSDRESRQLQSGQSEDWRPASGLEGCSADLGSALPNLTSALQHPIDANDGNPASRQVLVQKAIICPDHVAFVMGSNSNRSRRQAKLGCPREILFINGRECRHHRHHYVHMIGNALSQSFCRLSSATPRPRRHSVVVSQFRIDAIDFPAST